MIALAFAAGIALGLWLGLNVAENLVNAMSTNLDPGPLEPELGTSDYCPISGLPYDWMRAFAEDAKKRVPEEIEP